MKEEKYRLFMEKREKCIAEVSASKFNVIEDEIFKFLKYLTQKFFEFENSHKEKLCICIQKDIEHLIRFIKLKYNYELEYIYKRIDRVLTIWYKYPLEFIIEGKSALAHEYLYREIKEEVGRCFTEIKIDVEEQSVNRFINFCKRNYLSTIYSAIYDVSFGKYEYNNIINNLTLLAMNYERFLKTIFKIKYEKETPITLYKIFRKYFKLSGILKFISDNKKWAYLTQAYNLELSQKIKEIEEYVSKIPKECKEIVAVFLYTNVIRNYIAHHHDTISFLELSPQDCFNKIMGAYWYSWIFAEENYLKEKI